MMCSKACKQGVLVRQGVRLGGWITNCHQSGNRSRSLICVSSPYRKKKSRESSLATAREGGWGAEGTDRFEVCISAQQNFLFGDASQNAV